MEKWKKRKESMRGQERDGNSLKGKKGMKQEMAKEEWYERKEEGVEV